MKSFKTIVSAMLFLALTATALAGCSGNQNTGGENTGDSKYTVTATTSEEYVLTPSVTSAGAGEKVTVTAEAKGEFAEIVTVKYNDIPCSEDGNGYYFTMPAMNVTLTAEVYVYSEVKEDGIVSFDENNITTIPQNGAYNQDGFADNQWGLDLTFNASYMADVKSEIKSFDENVIPESAISLKTYTKADLGLGGINDFEIVKGKVIIDTSKISVGVTWLTMHFKNNNVSNQEGTLVIKITVCEYGKLEIETFNATVEIDVGDIGGNDAQYTVRICDGDFITGTTAGEKAFNDYTLKAENGIITINFVYAAGHNFWLRVSAGDSDDYQTDILLASASNTGAEYSGDEEFAGTGILTFTQDNASLKLVAEKK